MRHHSQIVKLNTAVIAPLLLFAGSLALAVEEIKNVDPNGTSPDSVAVELKVAQALSVSDVSSAGQLIPIAPTSSYNATKLKATTTSYAFAHIDGLKMNLTEVLLKQGSKAVTVAPWTQTPKAIEIGFGLKEKTSITESIKLVPGEYSGAVLRYEKDFSLKGYCLTNNKFIYTTSKGLVATPGAPPVLPLDYDYYQYSKATPSGSASAVSSASSTLPMIEQSETDLAISVAEGSVQLALFLDPSHFVTCYDGTPSTSNALPPFSLSPSGSAPAPEVFPIGEPRFGLGAMSLLPWIVSDAKIAPPLLDSYFVSESTDQLSGAQFDYSKVGVLVIALNADRSLYAIQDQVMPSKTTDLHSTYSGFQKEPDHTMSFFNGDRFCEEDTGKCTAIQDRKITHFTEITDSINEMTATIQDGPDCGKGLLSKASEPGSKSYRACSGVSSSLYFRKNLQ